MWKVILDGFLNRDYSTCKVELHIGAKLSFASLWIESNI